LRCQIGTSKNRLGGRCFVPYVFTEHGVAMLSRIEWSCASDYTNELGFVTVV